MVSDIIRKRLVAVSQNGEGVKYSDDNGDTWLDTNITSGSYKEAKRLSDGTLLIDRVDDLSKPSKISTDGGKIWADSESTGNVDVFETNDGEILRSKLLSSEKVMKGSVETNLTGSWKFSKWEEPLDANRACSNEGRELKTLLGVSTLPEMASKLRSRGSNRDYSGLRLGDYFDLSSMTLDGDTVTNDNNGNVRMEICGFGVFDGCYNTNQPGILFQCKNIPFKHRIHSSDEDVPDSFALTELGQLLNGDTAADLESQLGLNLRNVQRRDFHNNGDNLNCKVFLPGEVEVWGHHIFETSDNWCRQLSDYVQWPIYRYNPQRRIKIFKYDISMWWNGSRADEFAPYVNTYCCVSEYGAARKNNLQSTNVGVSFACYI